VGDVMNLDKKVLDLLLKNAEKAYKKGEIPVSAVILDQSGKIISYSNNDRQRKCNVLGHAEIIAIQKANKKLDAWILENCTMYVTLEPCSMCAGAILQSRIKRLVFGAHEPKHGACGSIINLLDNNEFNHQVEITSNILENESSILLKNFFQILRQKNK
jgi:tRNA(adenine34) deaminase